MADGTSTFVDIERDTALRNAVVDAAMDCIIMMDENGCIVEFNPAAQTVFGYTREEAVGANLAELIIPENLRTAHHTGLARYLNSGEHNVLNKRVEVPARNKAGDVLLVELAISPVHYNDVVFFSAYLRDITQMRAAEQKLKSSEERFQNLFELSPDAIVVINTNGLIVDANSRACQLANCAKEDMLNKNSLEFLPEDQYEAAAAAMVKAESVDTVELKVDFMSSDQRRIPTEVLGRRIDSADGVLFYGVIRDISQRILSETQLLKAKEAAEQANEAKSDFLANMSHEMRTPLNGVIGSLSLVERQNVDDEAEMLIGSAERSAHTLLTLIDDLLDLARIEAGQVELEEVIFNPNDLEVIIGELFNPVAAEKGIDLNTTLSVEHPLLLADVGKIRQVLINLVNNSLKFTQRGQVAVHVEYVGSSSEGELQFVVHDTGIGISEKNQTVLFERFTQADSSLSKSHGGVGLGLPICKHLVEVMGGRISVSSAPGVGSTFSFSVPVEPRVEDRRAVDRDADIEKAISGHVLIAEDSETNAMVAKKMLDKLGITYVHVTDGASAVDAVLQGRFDAVLMDVSMPVMDGLEATGILRDRGFTAPIIAMTAHALKGDRDHALQTGMDDYLAKPVRPQALRSTLGKWLSTDPLTPAQVETVADMKIRGLDKIAIAELWGDDLEIFVEIGQIFVEELGWRLPHLDSAKSSEVEHHAHSLKGAAANIGAVHLSELARELETSANRRDAEELDRLIQAVKVECEIVVEQLQQEYFEDVS